MAAHTCTNRQCRTENVRDGGKNFDLPIPVYIVSIDFDLSVVLWHHSGAQLCRLSNDPCLCCMESISKVATTVTVYQLSTASGSKSP